MPVYRGVVRGHVVQLTEPVDLSDGTEVEVRTVAPAEMPPSKVPETDERAREDAFEKRLLDRGIISRIPDREPDPPWIDRTQIDIDGPALSETVGGERR